ncbi:hypothetical protein L0P45_11890, partial [Phascolarctobacterium faecium]|uniref:hypothetical protein n=1 Tax=Phascolarctobacterium faecium TaxID=33025 RepID=UPI001EDD09E4
RPPSSLSGLFAFTHLACASAILSDPEDNNIHTKEWFVDLLKWVAGISNFQHQHAYAEIAGSIWQANQSTTCS